MKFHFIEIDGHRINICQIVRYGKISENALVAHKKNYIVTTESEVGLLETDIELAAIDNMISYYNYKDE